MSKMLDISVVVNTFNEGEKLSGCLQSVKGFANEILVVDMGSTDKTLEIAKKFGAEVLKHKHLPYVEPARNFGVSRAIGDWVLVLDPDERINKTLAEELKRIVMEGKYQAVNIPRKNIIFGKWIRHTNWWPDKHVRFFKKGTVSWSDRIHLYPKVEGEVFQMSQEETLAIEHLNYSSVGEFLERQNRYSEVSAKNRYDLGERFSLFNFLWKPKRIFLQKYIRHAGFLDGFYGIALTFLAMYAQLSEEIKLWEKGR